MTMLTLECGSTRLRVAPDAGAGIAAFDWHGEPVMRRALPGAVEARDPLGLSCFPLVPWSNRIAFGRFHFDGHDVALPRTMGDHPHAIHGQGWRRPWTVIESRPEAARLGYDHTPDAWPWAYRAEIAYAARDDGIDVTLAVENRAAGPMPAGLGLHPYYRRTPEMQWHARLDGWWDTDPLIMPIAYRGVAPRTDWSRWLHPGITTDNAFSGWDGVSELVWPERNLALTMTAGGAARWMVTWAPTDDAVTAVEPVTHPTDAFNDPALPGVHVLAPGERLELAVAFRVRRL